MDPVTLVATALAAGVALGVTDTASSAVRDAYTGLKDLVRRRLADRPGAELVLARYEQDPDRWRVPLMAELSQVGCDAGMVMAARRLMALADEGRARTGKYTVDLRGAQGVQVGDHNKQDNVFTAPPGGLKAAGTPAAASPGGEAGHGWSGW